MKNLSPFDILIEEHKLIKRFLAVFGAMLDQLEQDKPPALVDLKLAVSFIDEYADQYHHAKEETILFQTLKNLSVYDEADQIGSLEMEHFLNRSFCSSMLEALELFGPDHLEAVKAFTENARAYIALLIQHVCKEDHQFFPWCTKQLDQTTADRLLQQFQEVTTSDFDAGIDQEWADRVDRLKTSYGMSDEIIAACD